MTRFTNGFLFACPLLERPHVLLVQKTHPAWQAGLLNGIGGGIEEGEDPHTAMKREFLEETTLRVDTWTHFATLVADDRSWEVLFFSAIVRRPPLKVPKMNDTKEDLRWCLVPEVLRAYSSIIPNLRWLLPLAYDPDIVGPTTFVDRTRPDHEKESR